MVQTRGKRQRGPSAKVKEAVAAAALEARMHADAAAAPVRRPAGRSIPPRPPSPTASELDDFEEELDMEEMPAPKQRRGQRATAAAPPAAESQLGQILERFGGDLVERCVQSVGVKLSGLEAQLNSVLKAQAVASAQLPVSPDLRPLAEVMAQVMALDTDGTWGWVMILLGRQARGENEFNFDKRCCMSSQVCMDRHLHG